MKAKDRVKIGNTIIFRVDEFHDENVMEFDGEIQDINDFGVDVIYLSGYRSRNDFIPWDDVIAKVDKRKPIVKLDNAPYTGHFEIFD